MIETVIVPEKTDRVHSFDVLRGIAVLGILLVHVYVFCFPLGLVDDPHLMNAKTDVDLWIYRFNNIFIEGKMRGILSILFGISAVIIATKKEKSATDYYHRRLLWLLVLGLFNAFVLLWSGDILFVYSL